MTKLTYSNNLQLIAAFEKGAKFVVRIPGRPDAPVTSVYERGDGTLVVAYKHPDAQTSASTRRFKPDGSHARANQSLVETGPAMPSTPAPLPFLKRLINGDKAYNPATREVVKSVVFQHGAISVTFEGGRVSNRYDHEGRHRWVPSRSLVFGELPPLMRKVNLRIYKDTLYGGYVTLGPNQVLPTASRYIGAKPVAEIEIEEAVK